MLAIAVVAKTQADDDKLANALHRLQDEDPALVVDRDDETHQTVLRGTGETHLASRSSASSASSASTSTTEDVQVRYRETITGRRPRPRASTRSSPAATASSRWPASRSSRSSGARASSSSTRSSVARSAAATSRPCRRASRRRWPGRRERPPGGRRAGHPRRRQGAHRRHLEMAFRVAGRIGVPGGDGQGRPGGARADLAASRSPCPPTCWAT